MDNHHTNHYCRSCRRNSTNSKLPRYIRDFCEVTTLHGIRYVGEKGRHPLERIFWIVVIVGCVMLCGLEVRKIWSRWKESPVIVTFADKPSHISDIPFPAVTICTENRVKASILNMTEWEENVFEQKPFPPNLLKDLFSKGKILVEAASLQCFSTKFPHKPLIPLNTIPNATHFKLLQEKITPQISDLEMNCWFLGKKYDCREIFRPIITEYGLCYTFNMVEDLYTPRSPKAGHFEINNEKYQTYNATWNLENGYSIKETNECDYPRRIGKRLGVFPGLRLVLGINKHDLDRQELCTVEITQSFRVLLHLPSEFPNMLYGKYFHLSSNSETFVAVKPRVKRTASQLRNYSPEVRSCNFPEDQKLTMFKTYTEGNCEAECVNEVYRRFCGCQLYFYPLEKDSNLSLCSTGGHTNDLCNLPHTLGAYEILRNNEDLKCYCLPTCNEVSYHYQILTRPRDIIDDKDRIVYSALAIAFDETTFLAEERNVRFSVSDFVASFGGLLGLFTGFSMITLAELIYFATLRLICLLRPCGKKRRDKNGISTTRIGDDDTNNVTININNDFDLDVDL